jgi:hypothetical protein
MNLMELFFDDFIKVHEQLSAKDRNQASHFNHLRLFNDNDENTYSINL